LKLNGEIFVKRQNLSQKGVQGINTALSLSMQQFYNFG
jgi:hypothetical protein